MGGATVCLQAHGLLATLLLNLDRPQEAEGVILQALALDGGVADAYDALAYVSLRLGAHERANALYARAVAQEPKISRLWYNLASSHRNLGRLTEAEAACDKAISLGRDEYPSFLLRSELRLQTPENNHVEELQAALARAGPDNRAHVFLGYALAKELDDLGRYDEAFGWFERAAAARRGRLSYNVAIDEQKIRRIVEVFDFRPDAAGRRADYHARHIFIIGLPRSGTTLLERILTGLPGVRSNGETENFSRALLAPVPKLSSDVFACAAAVDPARVAEAYAKLADPMHLPGAIIEKLPMNYLYLGAIARALPEAAILVVSRSPIDSCFAMYRTLFGEAYPFSYAFDELARYYAAYSALMRHWKHCLGTRLFEVSYEALVHDPAGVGELVARHCGLPWRREAVAIQTNRSASMTASAAQVRRPIYTSSVGRWHNYREHLDPLIKALEFHGVKLEA